MNKPSSSLSSGNISPAIVGPDRGTKEVYILGGLVLSLAIVIGAFWFYSQDLAVSSARSNVQLTDNQVATLLKDTNATTRAVEPILTNAAGPRKQPRTGDIVTQISTLKSGARASRTRRSRSSPLKPKSSRKIRIGACWSRAIRINRVQPATTRSSGLCGRRR